MSEHSEHIARRLADGWYALHTCQECRREKAAHDVDKTGLTGCGHPHVMRHDYDTETWWQCEDCDLKFEPVRVEEQGNG